MSDYGDDSSDFGDDFFYVEDEYMVADDLAEHAVQSPPPTTCADEDAAADWDRFDYFNDLEYASDGYDDGHFSPHDSKALKTGEKRKRGGTGGRGTKKQKLENGHAVPRSGPDTLSLPPVVWRSQADREPKAKLWDDSTESYALLKDWRERLTDTPAWAAASPDSHSHGLPSSKPDETNAAFLSEPIPPNVDFEGDEEDAQIDPAALMASLQTHLAAAGGPLSGMDPQQLLQFAMRMVTDKDAGDDIAGEMAEEMLNQGEEDEEEEEGPADLLSWLDRQRNSNGEASGGPAAAATSVPEPLDIGHSSKRPPTPPSSKASRSIRAAEETMDATQTKGKNATAFNQNSGSLETGSFSRKRKADDDVIDVGSSANAAKKRATGSYDAPAAASQPRAVPTTKATRSGRARGS